MPPTDHDSAPAATADDRYGAARSARSTRIAAVVGGLVLAAGLTAGILGWTLGTRTPITWTDLGYEHVDEHTTVLEFQVSMDPGTTGTCQVQAQSATHGQVGYLEVPVGPSEERYHAYQAEIAVQEPAVSASVMGCELAE